MKRRYNLFILFCGIWTAGFLHAQFIDYPEETLINLLWFLAPIAGLAYWLYYKHKKEKQQTK